MAEYQRDGIVDGAIGQPIAAWFTTFLLVLSLIVEQGGLIFASFNYRNSEDTSGQDCCLREQRVWLWYIIGNKVFYLYLIGSHSTRHDKFALYSAWTLVPLN